jgi:exopolyphosphatase/guanosine-5'-triphosphate,3'-diphosphate pyrophosphatase
VERVGETTGLKMRLISGQKEAELGFRGALSALEERPRRWRWSTSGEARRSSSWADRSGEIEERVSLPLGTNRTTERFVRADPPTDGELEELRGHVAGMLPGWDIGEAPVVAVGGSARAMLKITSDALTVERLWRLSGEVRTRPSGLLAREHGLTPERARVLPAAITTLATVLEVYGRRS